MTKQIPINLHPHEERAAAEGRLGLIIRPVEPQPPEWVTRAYAFASGNRWFFSTGPGHPFKQAPRWPESNEIKSPLGSPGQKLWGREVWHPWSSDLCGCGEHCICPPDGTPYFRADINHAQTEKEWGPWLSPVTLPKRLSRAHLVNQSVRLARVQEITDSEVLDTGFEPEGAAGIDFDIDGRWWPGAAVKSFARDFWNATYAKRGLGIEANPLCWFVTVKEEKP